MLIVSRLLNGVQLSVILVFCLSRCFFRRVFRNCSSQDSAGLVRRGDRAFLILRRSFRRFVNDRHFQGGQSTSSALYPVFQIFGRFQEVSVSSGVVCVFVVGGGLEGSDLCGAKA